MISKNAIAISFASALLVASTSLAMAQATGTENNATTGSEAGVGPASGAEKKGTTGSMKSEMKGSSGSMEMKDNTPTSAGTASDPAKNLPGHSENPKPGPQ